MPSGFTIDKEIKDTCIEMSKQGKTPKQIYDEYFGELFPETTPDAFARSLLNWKKGAGLQTKFVALEKMEPNKHEIAWNGNQIIRFGLIGDTHFCSKYAQYTWLHKFYDEIARRDIPIVFHAGDITEGEKMRDGQEYEIYKHGADEQADEVAKVFPKRNGVTTKFITGNHDSSFYKRIGVNIGKMIADKRSDMEYMGRDWAVIKLTPKCTLELRHPWDGTGYALSYKPQKMIETMEPDSKPNILAIGHYHKAFYMFYRNIHCFQVGCFQGQTPFTRGKNISVHMGGWIVTVAVDKKGYIQNIEPEFIPFYYPIQDDYKKWHK